MLHLLYLLLYKVWHVLQCLKATGPPGFSCQMAWVMLICLHTFYAWLVKHLIHTFQAARKVNTSFRDALRGRSHCGYRFLNQSSLVFTNCSFFFSSLFVVLYPYLSLPAAEKEKRVKSGSDGEGASNSQSDSSASLGSLKGGGESCRLSSRLPLPLPHPHFVTANVASGEGRVFSHLSKVGLYCGQPMTIFIF